MVSDKRIQIAANLGLSNTIPIADAVERLQQEGYDIGYAMACASAMHESGGEMILGHDPDGIFSTNNREVTLLGHTYEPWDNIPCDSPEVGGLFLLTLDEDDPRIISNGYGIMQITYKPYFRIMLSRQLLPWDPFHNAYFGLEILAKNLRSTGGDELETFGRYNGGGDWRKKPAAVDYAHKLVEATQSFRRHFKERVA